MKKINKLILQTSLAIAIIPAIFTACASKADTQEAVKATKSTKAAHWGYTGHADPSHWGEISEKYKMCSEGKNQSPVDITVKDSQHTNLPAILFAYNTLSNTIINNGHTIQVNINDGSTITIDDTEFSLKQFHFHSPSENEINDKHFPLEAHFVHVDSAGDIAVVALMFQEGEENAALKKIWDKLPLAEGEKTTLNLQPSDVTALLPQKRAYYRFDGSLTTPPCTEGVRWFVMKQAVTISKAQVEAFTHLMHHANNRPIQKLNARKILD